MYNGIINVYKEEGFTSHDVVAKLRGILGQKKIGHTGTLDPDAVGVLPVCLGSGTKLCEVLSDHDKEYVAQLLLGVTTDTQDISGEVLSRSSVEYSKEEVRKAIMNFVGDYYQTPPMYSAKKVNGKKLYELAREGVEVHREPVKVSIFEIQILAMELPLVTMRVKCSKGTYIRTLCHDIGAELGCGGCMKTLERTRVGRFSVEDSLSLGQIQSIMEMGQLNRYIVGADNFYNDLLALIIKDERLNGVKNGNIFTRRDVAETYADISGRKMHVVFGYYELQIRQQVRVYDSDGYFYGIYEYTGGENHEFKPVRMFLC